jgi:Uma2 family endonuclease
MPAKTQATLEDLYHVPEDGKAEIVGGELVLMSPTGDLPSRAAMKITFSLYAHEERTGYGRAYPDNAAFIVNLPNRRSFSPDAAYYIGPRTRGKFLEGAPVFAAEVRSEGDYGPAAEREMAAKRRDYFAAGTLVVWDVDVLQAEVVRVFRASDPERPIVYRRGEFAEAELALPGWALLVDDLLS